MGVHVFPILNPPPTSLPIPSLWVIPVHQPQSSCILHQTWIGDPFLIWYYTCFNAILPNHSPAPSPTESKRLFYTWKKPRCPSADEWIRKLWYIYTMEYYSTIKKNLPSLVYLFQTCITSKPRFAIIPADTWRHSSCGLLLMDDFTVRNPSGTTPHPPGPS